MDTITMVIIVFVIVIIVLLLEKNNKNKDEKEVTEQKTNDTENETPQYEKWQQQDVKESETAEIKCYEELSKIPELKVFRNLYLFKDADHSTEIDVVAIGTKGIIVLESKDYGGWIFGSDNQKMWTQTFNKNSKFQFYNPIYQNKKHIDELMRYLNLERKVFSSAIVFGERAELKNITNTNKNVLVTSIGVLNKTAIQALAEWNEVLTTTEVEEISKKLSCCCNVTQEVKARHEKNVENARHKASEIVR